MLSIFTYMCFRKSPPKIMNLKVTLQAFLILGANSKHSLIKKICCDPLKLKGASLNQLLQHDR